MNETEKAIAEKMKCVNLAGKLGKLLGVNPVWKDNCVNYELAANYVDLWFDLENGCWLFTIEDYGFINLPKEAPDLMAGMSEAIEND